LPKIAGMKGPWLLGAALPVVAACLVLLIWISAPRHDNRLLVRATEWSQSSFDNNHPATADLPALYARSPDFRIWHNWPPATPVRPFLRDAAWTEPFMPTAIIGVPVGGYVQPNSGNRALIECMTDHRQRPLARLELFNRLSLVLVDVAGFCAGPIRVGAVSEGRGLVMIGTPIEISAAQAVALRYLIPLFGALLAAVAIGLVWVAGSVAAAHLFEDPRHVATFGLLTTGVVALAMFWVFSISAAGGIGMLSGVAAAAVAAIAHAVRYRGADLARTLQSLAAPSTAWLIFGFAILSLGAAIDNGGGYTAANAAFFPVTWSTDNQISAWIARAFAQGVPVTVNLQPWLISDRTPLLSGYFLLIENLLLSSLPDSLRFSASIAEQSAGIMVVTLWVPAAWLGLRLAGLREAFIVLLICLAAFTGFAIFNSLYIWPKLAAGGFGLLMILSLAALDDRLQPPVILLTVAAVSGALAILAYGGVVFGVLAALIVFLPAIWRQGLRPMLISGALGAGLLASWLIWQNLFQPGGNALVRFAFIGDFGFERRNVSVFADTLAAYGRLTLPAFLQMKGDALLTLIGLKPSACTAWTNLTSDVSALGVLRFHEFSDLYVMAPPAVAAISCSLFKTDRHVRRAAALPLLLMVSATTLVIWFLVTWSCHVVHHFSHQAIFAAVIGCWGIALASNRVLALLFAVTSAALTFAAWIVDPLSQALAIRWPWLLAFAVLLALGVSAACRSLLDLSDQHGPRPAQ